jgi:hypothetical protein
MHELSRDAGEQSKISFKFALLTSEHYSHNIVLSYGNF